MSLFELDALANKLQRDLDTAAAMEARRIAQAWLGSATLLTEWPIPLPENLRAWALELASPVYDNPAWLRSEKVGDAACVIGFLHTAEAILAPLVANSAHHAHAAHNFCVAQTGLCKGVAF